MNEFEPDYIPISMLNALAYCPRRFGYEYLQAEMLINEFVADGQILHSSVDAGGRTWIAGEVQERSVYVWNQRWRITGIVDLLESDRGEFCPVEYKRGKLAQRRNDHVQLCAQALCLEEMFGCEVNQGFIFSWVNRRREQVVFDPELRQKTIAIIEQAHAICQRGELPAPTRQKGKCRDCSLKPLCLPDEVAYLTTHPHLTIDAID